MYDAIASGTSVRIRQPTDRTAHCAADGNESPPVHQCDATNETVDQSVVHTRHRQPDEMNPLRGGGQCASRAPGDTNDEMTRAGGWKSEG